MFLFQDLGKSNLFTLNCWLIDKLRAKNKSNLNITITHTSKFTVNLHLSCLYAMQAAQAVVLFSASEIILSILAFDVISDEDQEHFRSVVFPTAWVSFNGIHDLWDTIVDNVNFNNNRYWLKGQLRVSNSQYGEQRFKKIRHSLLCLYTTTAATEETSEHDKSTWISRKFSHTLQIFLW